MATFGNTTIKPDPTYIMSGIIFGTKYPLAQEGQITSISVYLSAAAGDIRHAIYSDDAGAPDALQCETDPAAAAIGWNPLNTLTNPTLQPGDYWIVTQVSSDISEVRTTVGDPDQGFWLFRAWGAFPDPCPTPHFYVFSDHSNYSTYNPISERAFAHIF